MIDRWIHKTGEYQKVYREGIKKVGKRIIVYVLPGQGDKTRFGITVTRKIGNAVIRNRTKRVIREVTRKNLEDWNGGVDVVIVAKKRIVPVSFQKIEKELLELLQKVIERYPLPPIQVPSDR